MISNEAIKARTRKDWPGSFGLLDRAGGTEARAHGQRAMAHEEARRAVVESAVEFRAA
jgi:hypothetical protein